MKKKQIFLILLLTLFTFLSLFFVLKKNYSSLPDENWSKSIILKKFDINYDFNKTKSDNIFFKILNDKIYIALSEDNGINFLIYDLKGNEIFSKILEKNIYCSIIKGDIEDNIFEMLAYSPDENEIYSYKINIDDGFINEKRNFKVSTDKVFLEDDHFIYIDEDKTFNLFYNEKEYTFKLDDSINPYKIGSIIENGKLKMSILSNTLSGKFIVTSDYDILSGKSSFIELEKIKYFSSSRFIATDIIENKGNYFIYYEIYSDKYRTTYANFFKLNGENEIILSKNLSIEKFDPQIKIKEYDDEFSYIILENTSLGYIDISKKNEVFPNIILHKFDSDESYILTNTEYITTRPVFIEGSEFNYLVDIEKRNNKNVLLLSSNDPNIINKSTKLSREEISNLIFNTITTFIPFFYFSLPIFVKILIPIILIMIPISLIKLNWIENNQNKFLKALLIVHFLSKTYVFFEDIIFNIKFESMTFLFSNNIVITINYVISSLLSLYFLKIINDKGEGHLLSKYFKFAIFDIIFFTFIFYPYYFL